MPTLNLDFLVVPTYNTNTMGILDISTYPTSPPVVTSPLLDITPPGFDIVTGIVFVPLTLNIINSSTIGLTIVGDPLLPLPDGIYVIRYSNDPAVTSYVEKSIMRVDKLQEKFDNAFLKLDLIECDRAIKKQSKEDLMSIYFFIQGAIAAANNCAIFESNKLYNQADKMLTQFLYNDCGCSGNNYITNFT